MRGRAALLVAVTLVLAAVPLFGRASHLDLDDPNDTKGKLDIKRVKTFGADEPGFTVVTFADWTAADIWDRGYVLLYLDTFGGGRFDYFVVASSFGDGMQGRLWRDRAEKPDREIGEVEVWRSERDRISIRLRLAQMRIGEARLTYRWYVQSLWTGDECRRTCFDLVPETDGIIEPLPGATATPTSTPTPTPTPTDTPSP